MLKKNCFLRILLLIVILFIWSCKNDKINEVSFGYQPFGSNLPFFIAMEKGFFEEEGLIVKPVKIVSANDAANAIINGHIAGNATVPLNVLLNIEENQPGLMKIFMIKATSSQTWSDYLLVRKGSAIKSISQLKGKKVGCYPGSAQQTIIKIILSHFIAKDDFVIVEMPPSTQLQGLDSGQIDALLTYDDLALMALENKIAETLMENPICKYVVNPLYGFPYVISSDFINEHPKEARKIIRAFYKAADFIRNNEIEARKIMAKWVGTKIEIANKVNLWDQIKSEDIKKESLQQLADIFYKYGVTKKKINTSSLYIELEKIK